MTAYGKAILISLAAVFAFLIGVAIASEDRHLSDGTRMKIMAVLQAACAVAFAALVVSVIAYICKTM